MCIIKTIDDETNIHIPTERMQKASKYSSVIIFIQHTDH